MVKPYYEEPGITIYHGDCREMLPQLDAVDAIITDPPYGVEVDWWDVAPNMEFLNLCNQICNGLLVMFGGASIRSISEFIKLKPQRMIIWAPSFTLSHLCSNGMAWRFHPIWCWNLPPKQETVKWDLLTDNTECGNPWYHPCTKPLSLMTKLCGMTDGVILDPFMGSGTTLRAAKDLGRKAIGIEIEEKYCEIAVERLRQETLFKPKDDAGGDPGMENLKLNI